MYSFIKSVKTGGMRYVLIIISKMVLSNKSINFDEYISSIRYGISKIK